MPQQSAPRIFIASLALLSVPLLSQTNPPESGGPSIFRTTAKIVVVDVVVTGKGDRPVTGLHQQDFQISEDGKPQAITYFEEHAGTPAPPASLPEPPPNVFSNIPRIQAKDSVTVLLLDTLNTPLSDQNQVRLQVLKYLKKPTPGTRMAIFTLGAQLRLVQQFTDDPTLLASAMNTRRSASATQSSPLLQTDAEKGVDKEEVAAIAERYPEIAAEMQQALTEQSASRIDLRIKLTLQAFQQIAQYLSGIPGRKNLVWFSGGFPVALLPDTSVSDSFAIAQDDQRDLHKTDTLLAAAQVAIYPVAAEGLVPGSQFSAAAEARLTTKSQLTAPQAEAQARNSDQQTMQAIAKDTGGIAFYNTNGLSNAIERASEHGSYFYTLTYTSTNPATDGRFRKIQVERVHNAGYQLSYRRGYYADDAKSSQTAAAAVKPTLQTAADPLSNYLRSGQPDSTQVPLTLRVVRGSTQDASSRRAGQSDAYGSSAQGGDNTNLKGALTRYQVDLLIPAPSLRFDIDQSGHHHVSIETALVMYDRQGRALNWILRQLNLNLDAAHYKAAQTNGVNLYQEIDAPGNSAVLRGGVYDLNANLAGTLKIPLSNVVNPRPATHAQ